MKSLLKKYELIGLLFVDLPPLEEPEIINKIILVDGENSKKIRETIFHEEATHIGVYTKRVNDETRVIYYLFVKEKVILFKKSFTKE